MISEIRIQNFKSIADLALKPGRVTVLIGENGSGKSNILEAVAFASGAASNKLDNEFLYNRGIRVTEHAWMRSAFSESAGDEGEKQMPPIEFSFTGAEGAPALECSVSESIREDDGSFAGWEVALPGRSLDQILSEDSKQNIDSALIARFERRVQLAEQSKAFNLSDFVIYAPENTALRAFEVEGAIQPLGLKGKGLLKLLQSFAEEKFSERLADLKERLRLFNWFEDFIPPTDTALAQAKLWIRDRWLTAPFDQRSANEGFLYLLFYFTLVISWRTPKFFAIDNIESALNPKLCATMMRSLADLAAKYGKQVICTTHNPAILDGLNLHNDDERLFTVRRDSEGHTVVNRVHAPAPQPGEIPVKLSHAFLTGLIGGLPEHF